MTLGSEAEFCTGDRPIESLSNRRMSEKGEKKLPYFHRELDAQDKALLARNNVPQVISSSDAVDADNKLKRRVHGMQRRVGKSVTQQSSARRL